MKPVVVRPRTDDDLDRCVELAELVHTLDTYPVFLPTDLRAFLATDGAYGAWVAEQSGAIVGHAALHPRTGEPVLALASAALRQPVDRLGVVARLLVAPEARRSGVGRALLEVAANDALVRGLWPILDVAISLVGAVRLYESCGWIRAGQVTVRLGDSLSIDELVYLGPRPLTPTGPTTPSS
jgi:GNAT superfamily N-acetyltransferase